MKFSNVVTIRICLINYFTFFHSSSAILSIHCRRILKIILKSLFPRLALWKFSWEKNCPVYKAYKFQYKKGSKMQALFIFQNRHKVSLYMYIHILFNLLTPFEQFFVSNNLVWPWFFQMQINCHVYYLTAFSLLMHELMVNLQLWFFWKLISLFNKMLKMPLLYSCMYSLHAELKGKYHSLYQVFYYQDFFFCSHLFFQAWNHFFGNGQIRCWTENSVSHRPLSSAWREYIQEYNKGIFSILLNNDII
jgi:hypothetical protein